MLVPTKDNIQVAMGVENYRLFLVRCTQGCSDSVGGEQERREDGENKGEREEVCCVKNPQELLMEKSISR